MDISQDNLKISGIHHITAIAASPVENLNFYETVLGLRLVKQTVNFDDPHTYHLYYGDGEGGPGTIITFFPWQNLPRGRAGAGMVTAIAFAIPGESIPYWQERLRRHAVAFAETVQFGAPALRFDDPHGLTLELVAVQKPPTVRAWPESPIPAAHAIRGFHTATVLSRDPDATQALLTQVMGMTRVGKDGDRHRFRMQAQDAPGHFVDLVEDASARIGQQGGGTVHHIAFRVADLQAQGAWRRVLGQKGFNPTEVRDRNYFQSIYFREPGGVLFEFATDPPGFGVDEQPDRLGATLKLPAQYEPMRSQIESRLPPLRPSDFQHVYMLPESDRDGGATIVALHGTGGDEHDLVDLARSVSPTAAVLSPRGKVSENGMARYFRRLANGVLDEDDVVRRAHELADFIVAAASRYGRDPQRLTALGYSNGANVAAAILLLRPEIFERAILLRPMMPLSQTSPPDLHGTEILILKGRRDNVIPPASTDRLSATLAAAGARITLKSLATGHALTDEDREIASRWMGVAADTVALAAAGP
ncbi:MAG: VOC family protein [Desulfobacterales bacterium]|nr:VOC family protein [Desulfobacterales bacterium]